MPIMSFSISDELKKVITRLVSKDKFKNQSNFVRTALNHFINSEETQMDMGDIINAEDYKIHGQVFLSFKCGENESKVLKNIYNCEAKYADSIENFQLISADVEYNTCIYTFHGDVFDFRTFIDELDSIKHLEQMRYIINA